ncbi:MAG: nucleotidyltransferase family protein, partial [Candidatus Hodarchaeota archaeon]
SNRFLSSYPNYLYFIVRLEEMCFTSEDNIWVVKCMIRKALVLAAGKGTRLMPITRAIPKEMIRVGLKPAIEHVIEVLKAGGIKEILVIVGKKKESIMDHLGSGEEFGVNIYYKVQEEPKGTAHAVLQGRDFIGSEDFVVIYGDNYFKPYQSMKEILAFHEEHGADVTLVLHPVIDPRRYGIVRIDGEGNVLRMIEKPSLEEAEFYRVEGRLLSIAGLLVLNDSIFEAIKETQVGRDGEVWLTDTVEILRMSGSRVLGYIFNGIRYDIGTFESLLEADRLELRDRQLNDKK